MKKIIIASLFFILILILSLLITIPTKQEEIKFESNQEMIDYAYEIDAQEANICAELGYVRKRDKDALDCFKSLIQREGNLE